MSGLEINIDQAKFCYGMSKMTVINENPNEDQLVYHSWGHCTIQSSKAYLELKFTEFLEMIARASE
jgi:hypothetical protein